MTLIPVIFVSKHITDCVTSVSRVMKDRKQREKTELIAPRNRKAYFDIFDL